MLHRPEVVVWMRVVTKGICVRQSEVSKTLSSAVSGSRPFLGEIIENAYCLQNSGTGFTVHQGHVCCRITSSVDRSVYERS